MSADVIVASDPSDFLDAQRAAFKANLAAALDVDPNGVTITAVAAGSTVISFNAICDTLSIANAAVATMNGPITSLSTALGLQDEIGYAVARAHGRQLRGPPVTLRVRVVDRTMKKMSPLKVRTRMGGAEALEAL